LVITIGAVLGITKLKTETIDIIRLPTSDPAYKANHLLSDYFGGATNIVFVITAKNIFSKKALEIIDAITEEARYIPGMEFPDDILSLSTITKILPTKDPKTGKRDGFEIKKLLDPFPETDTEIESLIKDVDSHPIANKIIFNKARTATIIIVPIGRKSYPDYSLLKKEILKGVYDEAIRITKEYSTKDIAVNVTSDFLIMEYSQQKTRSEMIWVTAVAISFLFLVFFFYSGSALGTILPLLIVLLSASWTFGLVGFIGLPLSPTSIYIVIIIMAVGSSYPIHVMTYIKEQLALVKSRRVAIRAAVYQYAIPLLTVSITSVLTGISLLVFDIKDIREIGILQSIGITLAFIFSFVLIPILIYIFGNPIKPVETNKKKISFLSKLPLNLVQNLVVFISKPAIYHYKLTLLFVIAVTVVGVNGASKIIAKFEPEKGIPHGSPPREGFNAYANNFGTTESFFVVAKRDDNKTFYDPSALKELSNLKEKIETIPGIQVFPAFSDIIKELQEAMTGVKELPKTKQQVEQLVFLTGQKKLKRIVADKGRRTQFSIRLVLPADAHPKVLEEKAKTLHKVLKKETPQGMTAALGGESLVAISANKYMVSNKVQSIILCFVIVFLLCTVINSSITLGLTAVFPSALAGLITFAIMGYNNIFLDIATSTITTFAIGVGVDFGVHLLMHFKATLLEYASKNMIENRPNRELYQKLLLETVRNHGKTIVFDALSNILGLIALLMSTFPMVRMSGFLLVSNQLIVIAATFIAMPALLLLFRPNLLIFRKKTKQKLTNSKPKPYCLNERSTSLK